jgi:hypothetical protein
LEGSCIWLQRRPFSASFWLSVETGEEGSLRLSARITAGW